MRYGPSDFRTLSQHYDFAKPNTLIVLVHPDYSPDIGERMLPIWQGGIESIADDPNYALLIIPYGGPDSEAGYKKREHLSSPTEIRTAKYVSKVNKWISEITKKFEGRFAKFTHPELGLIPNEEKYRNWLLNELGNPSPVRHKETATFTYPGGIIISLSGMTGEYDFLNIIYDGMEEETCVAWQKPIFPCSSAIR